MKHLVRLAQVNKEVLVENSVTYLRVGDTTVVDNSGQNEVRYYYHKIIIETLSLTDISISLVEDLVLQLNIALQLKGELLAQEK